MRCGGKGKRLKAKGIRHKGHIEEVGKKDFGFRVAGCGLRAKRAEGMGKREKGIGQRA